MMITLRCLVVLPEKEKKRFLLGLYDDESDGNAYYSFNREIHVKDFKLPPAGSIIVGTDFNVNPMTSVAMKVVNGIFLYI